MRSVWLCVEGELFVIRMEERLAVDWLKSSRWGLR